MKGCLVVVIIFLVASLLPDWALCALAGTVILGFTIAWQKADPGNRWVGYAASIMCFGFAFAAFFQ